jgi:hypothetical protein
VAKRGSVSKLTGRDFVVIAMLGGQSTAWGAECRGTPEQQVTCTLDAFGVCLDHIPDAGKLGLSLRQRTADLSASCPSAFERTGSAAASSAR